MTCLSGLVLGMYSDDALDDVLCGELDLVDVADELLLCILLLVPLVEVSVDVVLPLPVLFRCGSCPGSVVAPSLVLSAVEKDLWLSVPFLDLDDRLVDVQLGAEGSDDLALVLDSPVLVLELGS